MSRRQPGNRKRVTQAGFENHSAIQIARPTRMFSSSGRHNEGLRTVMVYSAPLQLLKRSGSQPSKSDNNRQDVFGCNDLSC